jgi:hypothetical protein
MFGAHAVAGLILLWYSMIANKAVLDIFQAVVAEVSAISLSISVCIADLSGNVFKG